MDKADLSLILGVFSVLLALHVAVAVALFGLAFVAGALVGYRVGAYWR